MVFITLLFPATLHAASIQSGSAFLDLDAAARPAGLAGAYTASAGTLDTLAYNPAGLAVMPRKEAAFTHAEWLVGTQYDHLAYGHPTSAGTFALSATRLSYGELERRDTARQRLGTFKADDSAYALGYAHAVGDAMGLGASVKFLERKIDTDHASSYAIDLGGVGRISGRPLWLGASVLNIGSGIRFVDTADPLPLTFALGMAYQKERFKTSFDLKHRPHDDTVTGVGGIEYAPVGPLVLRAGYRLPFSSVGDESLWDLDHLRGGVGLRFALLRLDYALVSFDDLGVTHWFTASLRFGKEPETQPNLLQVDLSELK